MLDDVPDRRDVSPIQHRPSLPQLPNLKGPRMTFIHDRAPGHRRISRSGINYPPPNADHISGLRQIYKRLRRTGMTPNAARTLIADLSYIGTLGKWHYRPTQHGRPVPPRPDLTTTRTPQ